jgi:putative colanic acid biosynthesis UDP-glucose lipid carrier transferase
MKEDFSLMNETLLGKGESFQADITVDNFTEIPDLLENAAAQPSLRIVYTTSPLEWQFNAILKRTFDILLSSLLIILLLSWLIPILAILIKVDSSGPVFFLQRRNKRNGGIFTCMTFRSMVVNPEADTQGAYKNDRRITRLGKFLRVHHLDELPQLFNVLYGDMSIVGPRPHMIVENLQYEKLVTEYSCRHQVKPGITGLAQSLGYSGYTTDVQKLKERADLDLNYIKHWSMKMDMQIIFRTFRMISGI